MRLPLRHAPPIADAPLRRCAHLDALARAAIGLPLAAAAERLASPRSRGRYGAALQWHLGLAPHDATPHLDWEDRIEIKLVSVWRKSGGALSCDKIKVCDLGIDPWHKLSNVLWVFVDRLTRVVVATSFTRLADAMRERLAAAWQADPHFDAPALFVESRDGPEGDAPAYYLAASWFHDERLLPPAGLGMFGFDARWFSQARARAGGRDPWPSLATAPDGAQRCRRCGAPIRFDPAALADVGWAPAQHAIGPGACALRSHFVIAPQRLIAPSALAIDEALDLLEHLPGRPNIRLFERVPEPGDHEH